MRAYGEVRTPSWFTLSAGRGIGRKWVGARVMGSKKTERRKAKQQSKEMLNESQ